MNVITVITATVSVTVSHPEGTTPELTGFEHAHVSCGDDLDTESLDDQGEPLVDVQEIAVVSQDTTEHKLGRPADAATPDA